MEQPRGVGGQPPIGMHGEHADLLAIEAIGDAGLGGDQHRLGEGLRRCPGAGQHADLHDVAGVAAHPGERIDEVRPQSPDVATPRR